LCYQPTICANDKETINLICEYYAKEITNSYFGKKAIAENVLSQQQILHYQHAWHDFAKIDYAILIFIWENALGWKL
jgi:hypothetical protein